MFTNSTATPHAIEAVLTFLVRSGVKPKVLMPADPADRVERTGTYEAVPVVIHDSRRHSEPPTMDREGFALVRSPSAVTDFYDPTVVQARYYPEIIDLLEQHTGAREVHVFDHTVRVQGQPNKERPGLRQPVAFVHNDYTERSARQRVHDFFSPPEAVRLQAGRTALVLLRRHAQ